MKANEKNIFLYALIDFVAVFFYIFHKLDNVRGELLCDMYQNKNVTNENNIFYTIAGYKIPRRYYSQRLKSNISCPCSSGQLCLRKCCLFDDTFESFKKKCHTPRENFSSEDTNFDLENISNLLSADDFIFIYGISCANVIRPLQNYKIIQNRTFFLQNSVLELQNYCIEYFEDTNQYKILQCQNTITVKQSVPEVFTFCFVCSILLLIVTFVIYLRIDELRNLPSKILLCYITSLLISYIIFVILQIFLITDGIICIIAGYFLHFSCLASFFWLNVMCFDLWTSFRSLRSFNSSQGIRDMKKFIIYCVYAWGSPLIISLITVLAEFSLLRVNYIKPDFGKTSCFLDSSEAKFWYFYSIISFILIANSCMFIRTAILIFEIEKVWKMYKKKGSQRHNEQEKKRFFIYLKLFLIMGVHLTMEVLSYYIESPKDIWFIIDIAYSLQGVFIFAIFVCKKRVLILLNRKTYPNRIFIQEKNKRRSSCRSLSTSTISCSRECSTISLKLKKMNLDERNEQNFSKIQNS